MESTVSGASNAVHLSQAQSLFIDGLTEDGFDGALIAFAEKIEQFARILFDVFANKDSLEHGGLRRRFEPDVGRRVHGDRILRKWGEDDFRSRGVMAMLHPRAFRSGEIGLAEYFGLRRHL